MKRELLWVGGVCALALQTSGQSLTDDHNNSTTDGHNSLGQLWVNVTDTEGDSAVVHAVEHSNLIWGRVVSLVLDTEPSAFNPELFRTGALSGAALRNLESDVPDSLSFRSNG